MIASVGVGREPNSVVDKMFAPAAQKNARQTLAGSHCDQDRRFNRFDDFVSAVGLPGTPRGHASPRSDNNEVIFFGGGFDQNLRSRFPGLDCSLERDAGSPQDISLLLDRLSQWLFVARIFRDTQKCNLGLGCAGQ